MTKEQLQKELEGVKVLYVVTNRTETKCWIFYVKDGDLERLVIDRSEKDVPAGWVPMRMKDGLWYNDYFKTSSKIGNQYYGIADVISVWLYGITDKFKAIKLEWRP